ncbi:MAG: DNA polymerase III subunit [Oscillospiraceae bacterium]|jgi:DNA polymerase-3 subunit delta'|nr:DNA polymerase III subunit [Oscillospiraceae bacterium]
MLPLKLDDFIGNDRIKQEFRRMFKARNIPNSIIIEGESGLGKSTLSKIIANAAICSSINGVIPCLECTNCIKFKEKAHPDVIYPQKLGTSQSFGVDEIRKIKVDSYSSPNEAPSKVYIFEDAQSMTKQAQNAILWLLENPSEHAIFLLTCNSTRFLIDTLCSRCQIFSLSPVDTNLVADYLRLQNFEISKEKINKAAENSRGNIKKALKELSTKTDHTSSLLKSVTDSILKGDEWNLLVLLEQIRNDRKSFASLIALLLSTLKNAAIIKSCEKKGAPYEGFVKSNEAKLLAQKLELQEILKLIEISQEVLKYQELNMALNVLIVHFCSKMCFR